MLTFVKSYFVEFLNKGRDVFCWFNHKNLKTRKSKYE